MRCGNPVLCYCGDQLRAPDAATHFLNVAGAKDFFARGGLNSLRETPRRDE